MALPAPRRPLSRPQADSSPKSGAVTEPQRDSGTKCRRSRRSGDQSRVEKKEQSKEKVVIAPKGTRRQINESWYAAVARSEATRQSASPLHCTEIYCCPEKKRIPTTSDVGHWSRNDRHFLYIALSFPNWHSLHPGDPSVTADAVPAPLRGAPRGCNATIPHLCKPYYVTQPTRKEKHYVNHKNHQDRR